MSQEEIVNDILEKLDRPIVLVGMMGAGKTHLGRQLAEELGLGFVDTDRLIEDRAGVSIAEVFARDGEAKFREAEKNTILEVIFSGPKVIATGGGAIMKEESLQAMLDKAVMIWLDADLKILMARTEKNKNRPLLQQKDPERVLGDLLEARKPIYAKSHIRIDTSHDSAARACKDAIKALYAYLNHDNLSRL